MKFASAVAAGLYVAATAAPAFAQDAETVPLVSASGSATIASNNRFRGVSQSNSATAVQGGVTISHESGLYAGIWGSNPGTGPISRTAAF